MAKRFGRVENREEWKTMEPVRKKIKKGYRKVENEDPNLYDIMFPTSHDITLESVYNCLIVLKKLLKSKNTVLITTKPDPECITILTREFKDYKKQICFRFTVTSNFDHVIKKYEPNAPSFRERWHSVNIASSNGFKTSLSMEPFLDIDPIPIINILEPYVNDTIWLGIMSGNIPEELKFNYSEQNLKRIYNKCKDLPERVRQKIRFKDSIVNKLKLKKNHF
jgi:DNA repair photolyase